MIKQITIKQPVEIPKTPNYLRCGKNVISIKEFSDEQLKEIGELWVQDLINKKHKTND